MHAIRHDIQKHARPNEAPCIIHPYISLPAATAWTSSVPDGELEAFGAALGA